MLKKTSPPLNESLLKFKLRFASAWDVKPIPPAAEWCSDTLRMNAEVEASSGPYNLDERPYWRVILDAFDDPYYEDIVVKKSTQVGGTVTLWAHMLFKASWRPAPSMVVLPDRESAIEFRDRVYMNAQANPVTAGMVPPRKEWNSRYIDLQTMRIYLAWSGSAQKLRMRACQTVYLSEVDVFGTTPGSRGGDPNRAAAERTKSFYSRQLYRESSPTAEPSTIAKEYEQSNKGRWLCPCPHCGRHQDLRFFPYRAGELANRGGVVNLEDDYGQLKDADQAERDAKYRCKNGCMIEPHEIRDMVQAGVYATEGQDVDITGKVTGDRHPSRKFGIHLWSIHSPTITLGQIAREYVLQKRSGNLSDFFTNWLGLEYHSRRKVPDWQTFARSNSSIYERGTIWPHAHFVTIGVDVQMDRTKWIAYAYGDRCSMWLFDWGELWRNEENERDNIADDLRQLWDKVITNKWPTHREKPNPAGKTTLYPLKVGIDSNHRTMDVHRFVRWCNHRNVLAIRGDHHVSPQEKYRRRVVERNTRTGEIYEGGLEQWGIFTTIFKHDILTRYSAKIDRPGALILPRDMESIGKSVLQEMVNEPPKLKPNRAGRTVEVFEPRSDTIPVDYWDGTVYSRALAEMVVDSLPLRPGWDVSRWPDYKVTA